MSANLLEQTNQALGDRVAPQLARILSIDAEAAAAAIAVAVPFILDGLAQRSSSAVGVAELMRTLQDYDGSLLDQLGELLGNGRHSELFLRGAGIVDSIWGAQQQAVLAEVTRSSQLSETTTRSLLQLLTPLAMSVLGKHVRSAELDGDGLASLLAAQQTNHAMATPSETHTGQTIEDASEEQSVSASPAGALGGSTFDTPSPAQSLKAQSPSDNSPTLPSEEKPAGSLLAVFLPLILLAVLSWLGYHYLGPGNKPATDQATVTEPAPDTTNSPEQE